MQTIKQIYEATDAHTLKELAKENKLDYIVIDGSNRSSQDYKVNETLIKNTFKPVFQYPLSGTAICEVK